MTVMLWYSQGGGGGTCCVTVMVWYTQGRGYMLYDSDGMIQSWWGVHVV